VEECGAPALEVIGVGVSRPLCSGVTLKAEVESGISTL